MFIHFHKPAHSGEVFSKLIKEVVHVHDWLSGPALSEHDRLDREIAECAGWRSGNTAV